MIQLFFDPGGKCAGWAVFDDLTLVRCGLSRCDATSPAGRARHHRAFMETLFTAVWCDDSSWDEAQYRVLSECPQQFGGRSKTPPQDLIDLALIAGHVGTSWVPPSVWKGQVPKEVHQQWILNELSQKELDLVLGVMPKTLRHNAIDAVGIGLWSVGRMKGPACQPRLQVKRPSRRTTKAQSRRPTWTESSGKPSRKPRSTRTSRPSPRPKLLAQFRMPPA